MGKAQIPAHPVRPARGNPKINARLPLGGLPGSFAGNLTLFFPLKTGNESLQNITDAPLKIPRGGLLNFRPRREPPFSKAVHCAHPANPEAQQQP